MADDDAYGGVLGAVRYSYSESESRLFRSYVVVGALVTLFISIVFVSGIVTLIAATANATGGNLTVVRAFFVVVLLATIAPILAPILLVARRTRRGPRPSPTQQLVFGAAGYGYLLALYLGAAVSAAGETEPPATGAFAPMIEVINSVPNAWGIAFPLAAVVLMAALLRVVK